MAEFLSNQTELIFDTESMNKELYEQEGNNFNYFSRFLLSIIPCTNKIETITIANVPNEQQIQFPPNIMPINFCSVNSELGNLVLRTENITTLSIRKMSTHRHLNDIILLCDKLRNLHIESQQANEIRFNELSSLKLTTFKISGKYTSKMFPVTNLQNFLKSQAKTLIKLSIKIQNRPDIAYKLDFSVINFTQLNKLKFHTCTKFINNFINIPAKTVKSLKINSNLLTYTNLFNVLNQIENNEILQIIKFTNVEYAFPVRARHELIAYTFKGTSEIKFKQKQAAI